MSETAKSIKLPELNNWLVTKNKGSDKQLYFINTLHNGNTIVFKPNFIYDLTNLEWNSEHEDYRQSYNYFSEHKIISIKLTNENNSVYMGFTPDKSYIQIEKNPYKFIKPSDGTYTMNANFFNSSDKVKTTLVTISDNGKTLTINIPDDMNSISKNYIINTKKNIFTFDSSDNLYTINAKNIPQRIEISSNNKENTEFTIVIIGQNDYNSDVNATLTKNTPVHILAGIGFIILILLCCLCYMSFF
mgnify:CR=1 FL=1